MYGLLEIGGTKIIAGIADENGQIITRTRIATSQPEPSMSNVIEFFKGADKPISAIGVATFGPVNIDQNAPDYGTILKTPKAGWSHFSIRQALLAEFSVPIEVTTDVNGALLAEVQQGAAKGLHDAVYITIGTGVGAGILVNGQLVRGFLHPELGHMRVPNDGPAGTCPFHGDCLEGLICGPAIEKRFGMSAEVLPHTNPAWDSVAMNIADMCISLVTMLSTSRIILGGGVMAKQGLIDKVRTAFLSQLAGYISIDTIGGVENLIVSPALQADNGLIGALTLIKNY